MANPTSRGQQRDKPFRDALRMESIALEKGEKIEHPIGSLRWNAQRLLMAGEVSSIKETADRLDGKPAQAIIGGEEDDPAINLDTRDLSRAILEVLRTGIDKELKP